MARVIGIVSGKGGVGKSTLTSNLAYALSELGESVIAMDSNLTTPHLGLHLGLHLAPRTLHDVMRGDVDLENTIYFHPSGFRVIPASMNVNDLTGVDPERLSDVVSSLNEKCDILLLDAAPGLGKEAISSISAVNEVLLVVNPNVPSVADALKTVKVAEGLKKKVLGVVVNRIAGNSHELSIKDIEEIVGLPVITEVPEDRRVDESIAFKTPLMDYNPYSPASVEIRKLAYLLTDRDFEIKKPGALERFFKWAFG